MRLLRLFVKRHDLLVSLLLVIVVSLLMVSISMTEVAATKVDDTNDNKHSREEQFNRINKVNKIDDQTEVEMQEFVQFTTSVIDDDDNDNDTINVNSDNYNKEVEECHIPIHLEWTTRVTSSILASPLITRDWHGQEKVILIPTATSYVEVRSGFDGQPVLQDLPWFISNSHVKSMASPIPIDLNGDGVIRWLISLENGEVLVLSNTGELYTLLVVPSLIIKRDQLHYYLHKTEKEEEERTNHHYMLEEWRSVMHSPTNNHSHDIKITKTSRDVKSEHHMKDIVSSSSESIISSSSSSSLSSSFVEHVENNNKKNDKKNAVKHKADETLTKREESKEEQHNKEKKTNDVYKKIKKREDGVIELQQHLDPHNLLSDEGKASLHLLLRNDKEYTPYDESDNELRQKKRTTLEQEYTTQNEANDITIDQTRKDKTKKIKCNNKEEIMLDAHLFSTPTLDGDALYMHVTYYNEEALEHHISSQQKEQHYKYEEKYQQVQEQQSENTESRQATYDECEYEDNVPVVATALVCMNVTTGQIKWRRILHITSLDTNVSKENSNSESSNNTHTSSMTPSSSLLSSLVGLTSPLLLNATYRYDTLNENDLFHIPILYHTQIYISTSQGAIMGFNTENGNSIANTTWPQWMAPGISSLASEDITHTGNMALCAGDHEGYIACYHGNGTLLWRTKIIGYLVDRVSFGVLTPHSGTSVVFGTSAGLIYALNGTNGHVLPHFPVMTNGPIISPVLLIDLSDNEDRKRGVHIIVPSHDGHVYLVDSHNGCINTIDMDDKSSNVILAEDLTNDGYMNLLVSTLSGRLFVFSTQARYHPLRVSPSHDKHTYVAVNNNLNNNNITSNYKESNRVALYVHPDFQASRDVYGSSFPLTIVIVDERPEILRSNFGKVAIHMNKSGNVNNDKNNDKVKEMNDANTKGVHDELSHEMKTIEKTDESKLSTTRTTKRRIESENTKLARNLQTRNVLHNNQRNMIPLYSVNVYIGRSHHVGSYIFYHAGTHYLRLPTPSQSMRSAVTVVMTLPNGQSYSDHGTMGFNVHFLEITKFLLLGPFCFACFLIVYFARINVTDNTALVEDNTLL